MKKRKQKRKISERKNLFCKKMIKLAAKERERKREREKERDREKEKKRKKEREKISLKVYVLNKFKSFKLVHLHLFVQKVQNENFTFFVNFSFGIWISSK